MESVYRARECDLLFLSFIDKRNVFSLTLVQLCPPGWECFESAA